jgi:hypothetical protein
MPGRLVKRETRDLLAVGIEGISLAMTTPEPLVLLLGFKLLFFELAPVQVEMDLAFQGEQALDLLSSKKLSDGRVDRLSLSLGLRDLHQRLDQDVIQAHGGAHPRHLFSAPG